MIARLDGIEEIAIDKFDSYFHIDFRKLFGAVQNVYDNGTVFLDHGTDQRGCHTGLFSSANSTILPMNSV